MELVRVSTIRAIPMSGPIVASYWSKRVELGDVGVYYSVGVSNFWFETNGNGNVSQDFGQNILHPFSGNITYKIAVLRKSTLKIQIQKENRSCQKNYI